MMVWNRQCRECGETFKARQRTALFCGYACKQKWNNRRQTRGAELYDFVMADPRDPLVKRLIAAYRAADKTLRGGRPSSQDLDVAMMRLPAAFGKDGDNR